MGRDVCDGIYRKFTPFSALGDGSPFSNSGKQEQSWIALEYLQFESLKQSFFLCALKGYRFSQKKRFIVNKYNSNNYNYYNHQYYKELVDSPLRPTEHCLSIINVHETHLGIWLQCTFWLSTSALGHALKPVLLSLWTTSWIAKIWRMRTMPSSFPSRKAVCQSH